MVFWTWSEVFDALDFRIALVRVGRGASGVERRARRRLEKER